MVSLARMFQTAPRALVAIGILRIEDEPRSVPLTDTSIARQKRLMAREVHLAVEERRSQSFQSRCEFREHGVLSYLSPSGIQAFKKH